MDYYKVLELEKTATIEDIKKSYRRLSLKYHPDKTDDKNQYDKFLEITEAYQVLSNKDTKNQYDKDGTNKNININYDKIFNEIFKFINIGKEFFMEQIKKKNNKPKTINICVKVLLEDMWYCKKKKLGIEIKNIDKSETINITLNCNRREILYPYLGDKLVEDGKRGDIYIKIENYYNKKFSIIDDYDLKWEQPISIYEFYYGTNFIITHINGEKLEIEVKQINRNLKHIIDNEGLPLPDGTKGNLIIEFVLTKPEYLSKDFLYKNFPPIGTNISTITNTRKIYS